MTIVAVTAADEMALRWNVTRQNLADRHILFDEDPDYIQRLLADD